MSQFRVPNVVSSFLAFTLAACAAPVEHPTDAPVPSAEVSADLVLTNAVVISVDDDIGRAEAIAVRGDRIVAVGSNVEISRYITPDTNALDLQGATVIPGFIEGHGHFTGIGDALQILDLTKVQSWSEVVTMVADAVRGAKPGEWILGRGWHQEKWRRVPEINVEGFPTHDSISAVSPDNPVALTHASGHASFFNHKAMQLAGIDADTADPPGGEILHDADGQPSGIFRETAQNLVRGVYTAGTMRRSATARRAAIRRSIQLADRECLRKGVTSFQDAGSSFGTIDVMKAMAEAGELGVRLWVMVRESNERLAADLDRYRMIGVGDQHLTMRAIKLTIDGALGSRGAWLLEPYSDAPESTGLATKTVEYAATTAGLALHHDYQFCVHAIGDRANREALDVFERTFADDGARLRQRRWRIEHAQHLSLEDIPRFGELGVIASMQGVHCTSDGPWVTPRLGPVRAEQGAYVWQKLMQGGAVVTNGTDAPVEDVDPIASYYASVSRRLTDGSVFFPDQRMSRMEALRSYTINCAFAAFEEDVKGSLTPGKLADMVVLSQDITMVQEEQILDTEVLHTIVGGRILYASGR